MTTPKLIWIPLAICLALASYSTKFAGAAWTWFLLAGLASLWIRRSTPSQPASQAHELARTWLIFTAMALVLKTIPTLYWQDPWAERHAELRLFLGALGLYGLTRAAPLDKQAMRYLTFAGAIFCTAGLITMLLYGQWGTPTNSIPWAAGMAFVSCWLLGVFYMDATTWSRWLTLAGSIIGLMAVLASEKRGAYGLVIILPCLAWILWRHKIAGLLAPQIASKRSWGIYAGCALLVVGSLWGLQKSPVIVKPVIAIQVALEELRKSQSSLSDNYNSSVGARLYLWKRSVEAIRQSPWIGYGHAQRKQLLQTWANDTQLANPPVFGHVHNDYLHTLLDHGIWGLASFLSYAAGLLFVISKLVRQQAHTSAYTLTGILVMHLTTTQTNVNFSHNYYPTMLSLMICFTLWFYSKSETTKAP
ncbi:hypothetical protein B9Z38_01390 [Limnohabitans sp. MMS-10A-160]|uniref:O-antigen ligase family protein n=1 Tax=unclassified Limnohabitans TaxID=2626134 RepID=UPI000D3A9078|nr:MULTISPECIES: O-antigen ligase family protein [unclassified Limnohabitans]PUE19625.1 hypothetical protein B9Z43_07265 [Limnohabitans sp. MMS-10A-192]PUE26986.1 hypothetical protein B9Z38_01390 [Limnohabitans sp. MMS-10A-160]